MILLVEDEASLAESVRYNLEREGFRVAVAPDGRVGLQSFRKDPPSLVILDLMLPEMSGLDLCKLIRDESQVPIIMLTAKDAEADKVAGLDLGADDYVTKPFSMRELVSRVRAQLRRAGMAGAVANNEVLSGGPVILDAERHEVRVRGDLVSLPPKEFSLLHLLLARKGRLVTRHFMLEEIWGPDYFGDTKTLDVHVKRVREKVEENPREPHHIQTVRGLGYKFVE
ncbi:MAG: response regulator transcription factor [Actinobacteria bacterium]|nr:MAG: response regulator transcription factor [Actinomycetota bacterium]